MFTLCIPNCPMTTDPEIIKETFKRLDIADVKDVVFLHKDDESDLLMGGEYMNIPNHDETRLGDAFIHINYWHDNVAVDNFKERLDDPEQEARLVYDDPDYWIIEACFDENIDKLFSEIKQTLSETDKKLKQMDHYIINNNYWLSYLMHINKTEWQRKQRVARRDANFKAQKSWQRRLRPRPYNLKLKQRRGMLWAP